jgi:hypothetical protein
LRRKRKKERKKERRERRKTFLRQRKYSGGALTHVRMNSAIILFVNPFQALSKHTFH